MHFYFEQRDRGSGSAILVQRSCGLTQPNGKDSIATSDDVLDALFHAFFGGPAPPFVVLSAGVSRRNSLARRTGISVGMESSETDM